MSGVRSAIVGLVLAVAVGACGSSSPASSPLGSALSYFPKGSPFVLSVVTDPNAAAVKHGQRLSSSPSALTGSATLALK